MDLLELRFNKEDLENTLVQVVRTTDNCLVAQLPGDLDQGLEQTYREAMGSGKSHLEASRIAIEKIFVYEILVAKAGYSVLPKAVVHPITYADIYSRGSGPYTIPPDMPCANREKDILNSADCCTFPHKLNKDCDFYISDDCISYYSPTQGSFVFDTKSRKIVN